MKQDFIITLKRPGYRYIDFISIILLLLFLVAYGYFLILGGLVTRSYWLLLVPIMIIGLMFYGFIRRKEKDFLQYYRTELFIAALGWFLLPGLAEARYIGWLYAGMAFIERFVKLPDQWSFSKEAVLHNSFPRKKYEWVELDNVLIRENLFTLDLRNNKIVQKELESPVDAQMEAEFNDYCKEQLHFTTVENLNN